MRSFLRSIRFLTMTFWVGGIAFFAFAVAPVAFQSLPTAQEAGVIVRGTILVLHRIGLVCGAIFLAATLFQRSVLTRKTFAAETTLAILMLALTLFSHRRVLPAMETDRLSSSSPIDSLPKDDPTRTDFDRLHILSERLEGTVLLLGLTLIVLLPIDHPHSSTARQA